MHSKLSQLHFYDYRLMRELRKRTRHVCRSLNAADLDGQINVSATISFSSTGKQETASHLQVTSYSITNALLFQNPCKQRLSTRSMKGTKGLLNAGCGQRSLSGGQELDARLSRWWKNVMSLLRKLSNDYVT